MGARVLTQLIFMAAALSATGAAQAQTAPPAAMKPEAREHFDRGAALVEQRSFEAAARAFRAAYESDPSKEALFAWAQVERMNGRCARAIDLYHKFLNDDPTPTQADAANLSIRRCERTLQQEKEEKPQAPSPPAPSAVPDAIAARKAPPLSPPADAAPGTRRLGARTWVLLGGAAAALATAGTFYFLSRADENTGRNAEVWGDYYDYVWRARQREWIAAGAAGAGVLLGGAALVSWWLTPPARPAAVAWVGPGGGGITWRGRF